MQAVEQYISTGILTDLSYKELKTFCYFKVEGKSYHIVFNETLDELAHEMVLYCLPLLLKHDKKKSSLNYYLNYILNNYLGIRFKFEKRLKRQGSAHFIPRFIIKEDGQPYDILDDYSFSKAMERNVFPVEDEEFVSAVLLYWTFNLAKHFDKKQRNYKTAFRIIEILRNKERFYFKTFDTFIKYEFKISRQSFYLILKRFKSVNKMLFTKWVKGEQF